MPDPNVGIIGGPVAVVLAFACMGCGQNLLSDPAWTARFAGGIMLVVGALAACAGLIFLMLGMLAAGGGKIIIQG
jgi:protein-S-isoprenylcysteine O-methyltransferase Ste14